eukprot:Opistho-1_new@5380
MSRLRRGGDDARVNVRKAVELLLVDVGDRGSFRRRQLRRLVREVGVEVVRVALGLNLRLEGRLDLARLELRPVDGLEERVVADVVAASVRVAAEALARILRQEPLDHEHRVLREVRGVQHVVLENGLKEVVLRLGFKRRLAREHFVHEDPERPPVHRGAVRLFPENLGRNVVGRSAERRRRRGANNVLLAHAKVRELHVTVGVEEDVVELEVAVDDALVVKELKRRHNLGRVEPRSVLVEAAVALDLEHEVATVDILHHEEQAVLRLEARVEVGEEGVLVGDLEDALLRLGAVHVVVLPCTLR